MALSSDARERLLALIRADDELRARLVDQLEVTPDEDVALSRLIGRAFMLAETGDPLAARLVGLHRVAVAEPETVTPGVRPLTIHEAAWLVRLVKPLLSAEPKLSRALSDRQRELEGAGQPRTDATAIVATELLRMSADGQPPLDGHSELARAVSLAAKKIANGSWRDEPPATDLLAESAERSLAVTSSSEVAASMRPTVITQPGDGVKVRYIEDDERPAPSIVVQGGKPEAA